MTNPQATAKPLTLEDAIAAYKATVATLTPDEQTRIKYAFTDLIPLLVELAEGAAHPLFAKVPFVGGALEQMVDGYINKEEGVILALLT